MNKNCKLSKTFNNDYSPFNILLGKDKKGNDVIINMGDVKNLLISGMSGMGKTFLIKNIINDVCFNDNYENIKVACMDSNLVDYLEIINSNFSLFKYKENPQEKIFRFIDFIIQEANRRINTQKQLYPILCVIDDFRDIQSYCKLNNSNKFDEFIEAVPLMIKANIFVILSTSCCTANVITEKIKKQFTNRIAFAVSNSIDSCLIIEEEGAEKIKAIGDCLLKISNTITSLKHFK